MVDIDFFKRLNDRYGHPQGDECLKKVAAALCENAVRASDVVARFGGEEFAIVLPSTDAEGARAIAERIQQSVAELSIPNPETENGFITLSIGFAVANTRSFETPEQFLQATDTALYCAKQRGRNRIEQAIVRIQQQY